MAPTPITVRKGEPSFEVMHGPAAEQPDTLILRGPWSVMTLASIDRFYQTLVSDLKTTSGPIVVSGEALHELDTAGASLILSALNEARRIPRFESCSPAHLQLFALLQERLEGQVPRCELHPKRLPPLESLGRDGVMWITYLHGIVSFLGNCVVGAGETVLSLVTGKFRSLRVREFVVQLEQVFVTAVPIASLVTFLIGVVVAYLYASQAIKYGGQIFIVDAVSIAMCRELSPIIVAVIVAGRSGSAFTAQLGTMKLNEEIDALRTLGLSHIHVLVLPRIFALMLTMPLLVFAGDIAGIFGGVLIANAYLDITPHTFVERMESVLALKHIYVGFVKAPVFAMFIAVIGCYMGLTTEDNARSVGLHTTSTVVQSVVAVILLNATFAVVLVEMGI